MTSEPTREGQHPACPDSPTMPDGTPHTVVGCGSTNVTWDGEVWDCHDCGVFFTPDEAKWVPQ